MNVKRRIFMFGFSCFLGVLTLSLAIIGNNVKLFNGTFSETDPYSIVFDMNNNRLATGSEKPAGYSGSANALSELDNEVTFNYHLLTNPAGRWQTILEGGYFTNIDPIHGIASINITKSDIGAKVGIYWSNNTSFSEDRFSEFATTTNPVSIDFNEYIPNYIKVVSMGAYLNITSMTIELSCSDENPLIGDGTETIYMGMYPQSKVTDDALVGAEGALTEAAGVLPPNEGHDWTDYGYYSSGSVNSYMWYIDINNSGSLYRGVYFTSFRPNETYKERSIDNSYQDTNGYLNNSVHWFKYEPISWRVLDVEGGKAFLMADIVIDSQHFHTSSNNYENSYIRSWLNNDFYDTAFNIEEKLNIEMTTVDNSLASTGRETNPYICNDTEDNVFLLSYVEANDESYGLNTTASRLLGPSDYAKSQGVIMNENKSNWWLRTPHFSLAYSGFNVYEGMFNADFVDYTSIGVVPALWISL